MRMQNAMLCSQPSIYHGGIVAQKPNKGEGINNGNGKEVLVMTPLYVKRINMLNDKVGNYMNDHRKVVRLFVVDIIRAIIIIHKTEHH